MLQCLTEMSQNKTKQTKQKQTKKTGYIKEQLP